MNRSMNGVKGGIPRAQVIEEERKKKAREKKAREERARRNRAS